MKNKSLEYIYREILNGSANALSVPFIHDALYSLDEELTAAKKVIETARKLREAQISYMANRGNQEFGKRVAITAKEVDLALLAYDAFIERSV
jgi:hypothetical protein